MATLNVNGQDYLLSADSNSLLLYVLRDDLGLTGTKYGCGMAQCGACTVHLDGQPVRACITPVARGDAVTWSAPTGLLRPPPYGPPVTTARPTSRPT